MVVAKDCDRVWKGVLVSNTCIYLNVRPCNVWCFEGAGLFNLEASEYRVVLDVLFYFRWLPDSVNLLNAYNYNYVNSI